MRLGNVKGIYDYKAHADRLLRDMVHRQPIAWMVRQGLVSPPPVSSEFFAYDQFEPGPDFAHGADLDVDESQRQRHLANCVFRDVRWHLGGLLRPGDPHGPFGFDGTAQASGFHVIRLGVSVPPAGRASRKIPSSPTAVSVPLPATTRSERPCSRPVWRDVRCKPPAYEKSPIARLDGTGAAIILSDALCTASVACASQ